MHSDNPLPDSDPDPLHLVGQRTWTIGDWPAAPLDEFSIHEGWEEYSFTVTYDLRLVGAIVLLVLEDMVLWLCYRWPSFSERVVLA